MNRIRRKKDRNFVTVCNEILRRPDISLKAKGLYAVVMGLPDDWELSITGLAKVLKEGKDGVANTVKELIEHGYCVYEAVRDERGRIVHHDYLFTEVLNGVVPDPGFPDLVKPDLGKPDQANPPQYNIEELSIDKPKIDKSISEKPKKAVRAKRVPTTIPDDFKITPEMRAWADGAVPMLDIDFELPRFIDRCLAKGTVYADWIAGWRTQMKNAIEWGQGKLKEKSVIQQPAPDDGHRIDYSWLMLAQRNHPNQDWFTDRERYEAAKADWLSQYESRPDVYELCLKEVAEYESGSEFAERFPE